MPNFKVPDHLKEDNTVRKHTPYYTVPWAVRVDKNGSEFVSTNYSLYDHPYGVYCLPIIIKEDHVEVYYTGNIVREYGKVSPGIYYPDVSIPAKIVYNEPVDKVEKPVVVVEVHSGVVDVTLYPEDAYVDVEVLDYDVQSDKEERKLEKHKRKVIKRISGKTFKFIW